MCGADDQSLFWVDIIGYADRRADNDILATRLIVSYEWDKCSQESVWNLGCIF